MEGREEGMPQMINVPRAKEEDKKSGWRYDFAFMQKIQRISEKNCGEQISLEAVDAIIGALLTQKLDDLRCFGCGTVFKS